MTLILTLNSLKLFFIQHVISSSLIRYSPARCLSVCVSVHVRERENANLTSLIHSCVLQGTHPGLFEPKRFVHTTPTACAYEYGRGERSKASETQEAQGTLRKPTMTWEEHVLFLQFIHK